jgi:aminoglycoside phosphotransferase (APT) family kinase protein
VTAASIPAHVLAPPPAAALAWSAAAVGVGARVVEIEPITASRWHANHVLTIEHRGRSVRLVLRRWARPGWEIDDPDFNAQREADALAWLASTPVPAPKLVAVDPEGTDVAVPAVLITLLPGQPPAEKLNDPDRFVAELARALAEVHAVPNGGAPAYRPWHDLRSAVPPAWAPKRWHRLWEIVRGGDPEAEQRFIHRDYHHGNTLWSGGKLVGVVDWTTASIGSRGVDVAHARWNLALDYGPALAADFLDAYRRLAPDYRHQRYWDAAQVLDWLGEEPVTGIHFERLDRYVADVLD